jgi:release factor glutamine methyltransferase
VLNHIANLPAPVSVIDLGSGSGALALAIATEAANSRVIAVEKSDEALIWLKKNVEAIVEDLRIVQSDVSDALVGIKCDVVIANPPYIEDESDLPRDVVEHEPQLHSLAGKMEWMHPAHLLQHHHVCLSQVDCWQSSTMRSRAH